MFDWNIAKRLDMIEARLYDIQRSLAALHRNTRKIGAMEMATLQQVLDDVSQESTQIDSVSTLIAGLRQQINDAMSGNTLPPNVQNQIDQIFARAEANKQKIADALAANTQPQAPADTSQAPASDQTQASSGQGGNSDTGGQTS